MTRRLGTTLAALAVPALAALGSGAGVALAAPGPGAPVTAVLAQAPAEAPAQTDVVIHDNGGRLSDADREMLEAETPKIALPEQVREVVYVAFDDIDEDDLNDAILAWAGAHAPELVPDGTGEGAKWAPGTLIVAVSTGAREVGVYCGDNVCSALDLFEGDHLDRTLEDMKPPLKDDRENVAVAFLDGVRTASDPSLVEEGMSGPAIGAMVGGIGAALGLVIWWAAAHERKKKIDTAREQFGHVSREWGEVAQRLDQIDIRANSLTSPIADAELRRQWDEVRAEFVGVGDIVSETGLTPEAEDKEFHRHAARIGEADQALTRMQTAEDNIETLFQMEQGDSTVRHTRLTELAEDLQKAVVETKDSALRERLEGAEKQALELRERREDPQFMDRFAELIRSAQSLLALVRQAEMDGLEVGTEERHAPRIYDADWRVGHGYGGYVPFYYLSTWHAADTAAAASTSSTNTSFSSGFSGGGGSSGY